MYKISCVLQKPETKFKVAGTARVRAKIVSERRDRDGKKHECSNPNCLVPTQHFLTAKSREPFVVFIGPNVIVATDEEGSAGVDFLVRDIDGGFHVMHIPDQPLTYHPRF